MKLPVWCERLLSPGYSWCYRCRRPWKFVDEHAVSWSSDGVGLGGFALCEGCWQTTTPDERVGYFRRAWIEHWHASAPPSWEEIEAAVRRAE